MPSSTRTTRSTAKATISEPGTDEQSLQSPAIMPASKKTKLKNSGTEAKKSKTKPKSSTEKRVRTKKPKNEDPHTKDKQRPSVSKYTSDEKPVLKRPGRKPSSSSGYYGGDEDSGELEDDSHLSVAEEPKDKDKEQPTKIMSPKLFRRTKVVSWDSAASNTTGKTVADTEIAALAGRKRKRNVPNSVPLAKKKRVTQKKRNRWGETLSEEEEREKEEDGDELSPSLNPSPTTLEALIRSAKRSANKSIAESPKGTRGPRLSGNGEKDFSLYGFPPTPGVSSVGSGALSLFSQSPLGPGFNRKKLARDNGI
jgi:hypothetical protein